MVVKCFGTVYEIKVCFKVMKLYHFDLLKPCNATDIPRWIVRARKHFVWDDASQKSLEARKIELGQVQSTQSANQ